MIYKHFRINLLARVGCLCATVYLFFFLLFETKFYATLLIVGAVVAGQTYYLLYYVERTNRDLTRFLQAIRYEDFSQSFIGAGLGSSFNELKAAFTEVLDAFRETRAEREENHRYLQTVVQHVGIGLICFEPDGEVVLINTAAQRTLRTSSVRNVRDLTDFSEALVRTLLELEPGQKALLKVDRDGQQLQLVVYATELRMRSRALTLVSIQNIQRELEEKEMEAWQNLIRVLTHEIMNSVTPIASLASTVKSSIAITKPDADNEADSEMYQDITDAVSTIEKRSNGLLRFVQTYRELTRIPKPNFQVFPVSDLFTNLEQLMRAEIRDRGLDFKSSIEPSSLSLTADPELVEQILINLLLNAIQALEGREGGRIRLIGKLDGRGNTTIQVCDNGPGILKEVQERIFIPFFTTKQEGSGIGLSLSRQIMRLHSGSLSVQSTPGVETVFTLHF
jgi:two-component system, NtrC family, nitrogen regulation sensor histidine kinase NtrY